MYSMYIITCASIIFKSDKQTEAQVIELMDCYAYLAFEEKKTTTK